MSDYFAEREAKAVEKAVKEALMKTEKRLAKEAQKAIQKVKEEVALNVLKLGKLSFEDIAECSGLTLERVQMLADTL